MKIAYLDCFSGISGDMLLAALLDAGYPLSELRRALAGLGLEQTPQVEVEETRKGALRAARLIVSLPEQPETHRHYPDIVALLQGSGLEEQARQNALAVFSKLAQAEARVHGSAVEEVHFHEVGALDSIVDIVGIAAGLAWFGIDQLYASALPYGCGSVQSQHGVLPLPAPATLELLRGARAPLRPLECARELVTPTGAAVLAALARFEQPDMRLTDTGTGAGNLDLPWPNVLRVMIGESEGTSGGLVMLETNIDDSSPEVLGHTLGRLLAAGALDVFYTPILMKKNRPAYMLSVLARRADEPALARLVMAETSTFGLRVRAVERREAERETAAVQTVYGSVRIKYKLLEGRRVQAAPEYEDCARLAESTGAPLLLIMQAAQEAANKTLSAAPRGDTHEHSHT